MNCRICYFLVLSVFCLNGCSAPWYGYSKKDWSRFSADEQAEIKREYEYIFDAREQQKHKDKLEQRKRSIIDYGASYPRY